MPVKGTKSTSDYRELPEGNVIKKILVWIWKITYQLK